MWFWHWAIRPASRAACTAGSNSAIKMPMIVITTSSSTSVNPFGDDKAIRMVPRSYLKAFDNVQRVVAFEKENRRLKMPS